MAHVTSSHFFFETASTALTGAVSPGGASAYADLPIGGGIDGPAKCFISSVRVISSQDLISRLEFYRKTYSKVVNTASYFPPSLIGWVDLLDTNSGVPSNWPAGRFAVATTYGTFFAWFLEGITIPYEDLDPGTGQLHINWVNLSDTAKTAGTGTLNIQVGTVNAS